MNLIAILTSHVCERLVVFLFHIIIIIKIINEDFFSVHVHACTLLEIIKIYFMQINIRIQYTVLYFKKTST